MPSFLSENTRTDIPVVKPVDIQNRVLRNKPRSKSDRKEKKRRKRLSAYIVYYVIFGILADSNTGGAFDNRTVQSVKEQEK